MGTLPKTAKRPQPKGGSRKGKPNKSTALAREAIARFVDDNSDRLQGWLDHIASESPEKAFNAFMGVIEYHVPKLARTVVTGDPDNPINHSMRVEFIKPK